MIPINEGDVIVFDYTNWKGETSKRKAMVKAFAYGSNEYHKEPQMMIIGLDLDKLKMRTYAILDMFNIEVIDIHD
jgi:hypothetical protein